MFIGTFVLPFNPRTRSQNFKIFMTYSVYWIYFTNSK